MSDFVKGKAIKYLWRFTLALIQTILFILKISGAISWSWTVVLIPLWIYLIVTFLFYILVFWAILK